MKKRILRAIASVAIISSTLSFTACSEREIVKEVPVVINANVQMDAEELALAGEQLVGPFTFMLADKVFNEVLKKDPNNKRAQFYKAFLEQFMVTQGAWKRIRPLIRLFGDVAQYESEIAVFPSSPFKNFMLDGNEDIDTVGKLQSFLDQYGQAVNNFRIYLKSNPTLDLTLNLNPHVFENLLRERADRSCAIVSQAGSFESNNWENLTVECNYQTIAQTKLNGADIRALQQVAAGQALYTAIYTSYSVNNMSVDFVKGKEFESRQEIIEGLKGIQGFGTLREQNTLSVVRDLGSDLVAAWKWALDRQGELCPHGHSDSQNGYRKSLNRPGHLVEEGVCVGTDPESMQSLALFENILGGVVNVQVASRHVELGAVDLKNKTYHTGWYWDPTTEYNEDPETGEWISTSQVVNLGSLRLNNNANVNILAAFDRPIQDLRQVLPNKYDEMGEPTALADPTLGGVFVDGDANEKLFIKRPESLQNSYLKTLSDSYERFWGPYMDNGISENDYQAFLNTTNPNGIPEQYEYILKNYEMGIQDLSTYCDVVMREAGACTNGNQN